MFPAFSVDNSLSALLADAPLAGESPNWSTIAIKATNLAHIIWRKAGRVNRFTHDTISVIHSSFGDHILGIIRHRSQPEMGWINATWVISVWAIVQNIHAVGDSSKVEFPRNAMGESRAAFSARESAITVGIFACLPKPTIGAFAYFDLFPEFVSKRLALAVSRDESDGLTNDPPTCDTGVLGNWGRLAASAHAQSGGVYRRLIHRSQTMLPDVRKWLPLGNTKIFMGGFCNSCLLSASTAAVAVGDFVRRFVRGIITHVRRSFHRLNVPRAISSSAVVSLFPWTSIIAQMFRVWHFQPAFSLEVG